MWFLGDGMGNELGEGEKGAVMGEEGIRFMSDVLRVCLEALREDARWVPNWSLRCSFQLCRRQLCAYVWHAASMKS